MHKCTIGKCGKADLEHVIDENGIERFYVFFDESHCFRNTGPYCILQNGDIKYIEHIEYTSHKDRKFMFRYLMSSGHTIPKRPTQTTKV